MHQHQNASKSTYVIAYTCIMHGTCFSGRTRTCAGAVLLENVDCTNKEGEGCSNGILWVPPAAQFC